MMLLRFMAISILMLFLQSSAAVAVEPASSEAKAALGKRSYPWYDAKKDAYRPVQPDREPPDINLNLNFSIPFARIVMWMLLGLVIALLLLAVFQWLRSVLYIPQAPQHIVEQAQVSLEALEALPESARTVHDLLSEAGRLARLGAYGQAMVFYHSWQLVELDKQQALELQKGKTNRRYLTELIQSRPQLTDLFRMSTRLFEDAFFGKLPVSQADFDFVWNLRASFSPVERRPST